MKGIDVHCTPSVWLRDGEDPPDRDSSPRDQANHVADMLFATFAPDLPKRSDYKWTCNTLGYRWAPVRQELLALGFYHPALPAARKGGLYSFLNHWAGIVALEDLTSNPMTQAVCENGLALLLRHKDWLDKGLDAQVPCKVKGCRVCGPAMRARRVEHIVNTFRGRPIHAVMLDEDDVVMLDDSNQMSWDTFGKTYFDRGDANYHRIPSQDGMTIVLTDADVGEVITAEEVDVIIYIHPDEKGRRRMTASRPWVMRSGTGNWERLGYSQKTADERDAIYQEVGCAPELAPWRGGFVSARNVTLPTDPVELNLLKEKLGMPTDAIRSESGWPM